MANIMLTRKFSGFQNREDEIVIGNTEFEGDAEANEFSLPEGYSHDETDNIVRDRQGIACELVPEGTKAVRIISRAGAEPDAVIHAV